MSVYVYVYVCVTVCVCLCVCVLGQGLVMRRMRMCKCGFQSLIVCGRKCGSQISTNRRYGCGCGFIIL